MGPTTLHALGRNCPKLLVEIDLRPPHIRDLALTLPSQDQQPKNLSIGVAQRGRRVPHGPQLVIGKRSLSGLALAVRSFGLSCSTGDVRIPNSWVPIAQL